MNKKTTNNSLNAGAGAKRENNNPQESVNVRGRQFVGTVVSDKPQKTVIVEWERRKKISKYERYEKRRTRVAAHNPESINAKLGDKVKIAETRPISKTKHFIVLEKMGVDEAKLIKDSESESKPNKESKIEAEE